MNRYDYCKGPGRKVLFFPMGALILAGMGIACDIPSHPNQAEIDAIQAQPVSYPFTFVMMGDSRTPGAFIFAEIRSQILDLTSTPRFVIDIGDLVLTGAPTEYTDYVNAIKDYPIPFLSVIGNHEMYYPGGRESFVEIFGPEDAYFDYGNGRFIWMNNSVGSYGLTDEQLSWLETLLVPPVPPDKFVFMHVPPTLPGDGRADLPEAAAGVPGDDQYAPIEGGVLGGIAAFPKWEELIALVEAYGVRIAGFAHNHIFQHSYHNGVHYVITGGGGAETGFFTDNPPDHGIFHHFLVATIHADGMSKVQLIKRGAGTTPDDRYEFAFQTTPASL